MLQTNAEHATVITSNKCQDVLKNTNVDISSGVDETIFTDRAGETETIMKYGKMNTDIARVSDFFHTYRTRKTRTFMLMCTSRVQAFANNFSQI